MQADLEEVGLQEKQGKISRVAAIKKRAEMEKESAQREHPDMVASLDNILGQKFRAIDTKTNMEMMGTRHGADGLNSMQKLGAFTAQAGNPIIPLHQRTNQLLAAILSANKGLKEYQANRQGGVAH